MEEIRIKEDGTLIVDLELYRKIKKVKLHAIISDIIELARKHNLLYSVISDADAIEEEEKEIKPSNI